MNTPAELSWREAWLLIQESGRGGNDAMDILDDLVRRGPGAYWSYFANPANWRGELWYLRYAGLRKGMLQPFYVAEQRKAAMS